MSSVEIKEIKELIECASANGVHKLSYAGLVFELHPKAAPALRVFNELKDPVKPPHTGEFTEDELFYSAQGGE